MANGDPFPDIFALIQAFLRAFVAQAERDLTRDLQRWLRRTAPRYRGHLKGSVRAVIGQDANFVVLRFYAGWVRRQRPPRWLPQTLEDWQRRRARKVLNRTFRRVSAEFGV